MALTARSLSNTPWPSPYLRPIPDKLKDAPLPSASLNPMPDKLRDTPMPSPFLRSISDELRVQWSTGFDAYWHLPLCNDHCIRLLKLLPGTFYDVIHIELIQVSLNAPPDYEALSYAWDSQSPDRKAICEKKELLITPNCEAALRKLRRTTTRLLWIDSICINQSSLEERGHQVKLMGELIPRRSL